MGLRIRRWTKKTKQIVLYFQKAFKDFKQAILKTYQSTFVLGTG
jgi:hypothetical protein